MRKRDIEMRNGDTEVREGDIEIRVDIEIRGRDVKMKMREGDMKMKDKNHRDERKEKGRWEKGNKNQWRIKLEWEIGCTSKNSENSV